ncbi:A disintegrin and metalloproteinase with thrombospondin motifs 9 isoform X1, partial [Tachysurus ichikawai]
CSVSCADGWMERMVQCYSEEGEVSAECDSSSKPEGRRSCTNPECECKTHQPSDL